MSFAMLYFLKLSFFAVLLSPIVNANAVDLHERQLTSLTAVTSRRSIQKREDAFALVRECDHHYADRK